MTNDRLIDPYSEVPDEEKARINADISKADKALIQSVCPHRGVLQAMVNSFIKAVVNDCRESNVRTYEDASQFIELVRRRTSPLFTGAKSSRDDGGGTATLQRSGQVNQSGVVQRPPKGNKTRGH